MSSERKRIEISRIVIQNYRAIEKKGGWGSFCPEQADVLDDQIVAQISIIVEPRLIT
jgi:hypothetical protein